MIKFYIKELFRPLLPIFLTLLGGLGALYFYGTGKGGRLLVAAFLLIALGGVVLFAMEETQKNKVLQQQFGDKLKKSAKKHKKMGKRCPQCEKIIYHRRTVCQHCGYEFPSADYKQKLAAEKNSDKTNEAKA